MTFLLFLLGISYYFIFFFFFQDFEKDSFFSLFFEAHIYIAISLLSLIPIFSKKYIDKHFKIQDSFSFPSKKDILRSIKSFLESQIYYVWIFLFYVSVYFILRGYFETIHISQIFFVLNLWVFISYIFTKRFSFFFDILRLNTFSISFYYSFLHLTSFFWYPQSLSLFDIGNISLIFFSFFLLLFNPVSKKYMGYILWYFFIYFFFELWYIIDIFSSGQTALLLFSVFSWLLVFFIFLFPLKILEIFPITALHLQVIWRNLTIMLWSIVFIFWIFDTSGLIAFYYLALLSLLFILLIQYAQSFHNSTAFILWIVFLLWCIEWSLFQILEERVFRDIFSWVIILFSLSIFVLQKFISKYLLSWIIEIQVFFIFLNIIGVFLFFFFQTISILYIWYILAIESIFFLWNYYLFKKKLWKR